ncbi:C2H2-type domain-containing protein [Plasmodiophora brassicae]
MPKRGVVEDSGRKKWDAEEYERKILAGEIGDQARRPVTLAVMEKSALRARDESLSLDADVGKTAQVSLAAAPADQIGAGWYCQACDRQFKDNKSWLDHLNSQMHQHAIGNELRVERATLAQVKERIEFHRRQRQSVAVRTDVATRLAARQAEEDARRQAKLERRQQRKAAISSGNAPSSGTIDHDMAAAGFNFTFGGSRKNK